MANLNPTAYANGGITIPNGLVSMPNNPRGITPMHLTMAPSLNPIGFPTMLAANMNNPRQMQMSMSQTPSPPIPRNPVSYLPRPAGKSILRVFLFGEYLTNENGQNKKDINHWRRIVSEFFSEEGRMIYGLWNPEAGGNRIFDIPNPVISRFFQVNFESGVTSIQLTMNNIKETFSPPISIANNCIAHNSSVDAKASMIYNYDDGSRVVASGRLKVRLNHYLKIDCFDFNTEKHMEYVPRQQTMSPESPIGSLGIPKRTLRCLELAEGVVTLHDLIEKSISSNKGPLQTLLALANPEQSQTIINQSNNTPPTPGPSPPEPPAKTPKEKTENANTENTQQSSNIVDMPVPSPSTSNVNIKDSPKPNVKSPIINSNKRVGETTPKSKRRTKPPLRKNSRQETG